MLMTLISRVNIRADCVEIAVHRSRLVKLLGSRSIGLVTHRGTTDNEARRTISPLMRLADRRRTATSHPCRTASPARALSWQRDLRTRDRNSISATLFGRKLGCNAL